MARNRYNHKSLIESYQPSPNKALYPGMVIDFKYKADNIFDKNPFVLVLWNEYKKYKVHGINLNYLTNTNMGLLFDKMLEGAKIYGRRGGNPFVVQDQDDENDYDDNLPYRNLLKRPYTRMKLPTYRERRGGNPVSESEAKIQMKMIYEKVLKRFLYKGESFNVYRTYKYKSMGNIRVLNIDLEKVHKGL